MLKYDVLTWKSGPKNVSNRFLALENRVYKEILPFSVKKRCQISFLKKVLFFDFWDLKSIKYRVFDTKIQKIKKCKNFLHHEEYFCKKNFLISCKNAKKGGSGIEPAASSCLTCQIGRDRSLPWSGNFWCPGRWKQSIYPK